MNETAIKTAIIDRWLTLPEHLRRTETDAAGFVLRLMVDHPDLIRIQTREPLKVIKSWLCEHLPQKQQPETEEAGYQ